VAAKLHREQLLLLRDREVPVLPTPLSYTREAT
jgi:hypothetical protein